MVLVCSLLRRAGAPPAAIHLASPAACASICRGRRRPVLAGPRGCMRYPLRKKLAAARGVVFLPPPEAAEAFVDAFTAAAPSSDLVAAHALKGWLLLAPSIPVHEKRQEGLVEIEELAPGQTQLLKMAEFNNENHLLLQATATGGSLNFFIPQVGMLKYVSRGLESWRPPS